MVPTWMAVTGAITGHVVGVVIGFYLCRMIGASLRYGRHSLAITTPALAHAGHTAPKRNPYRRNVNHSRTRLVSDGWAGDPPTDHLFRHPAPAAVRPYVARHTRPGEEGY